MLSLALALFFLLVNPSYAKSVSYTLEQFEPYVEKTLAEWKIPGAAVAIVDKDNIVFMRGFGVRSLTTKEPVDTRSVFRIGSLSKGFAAELTGIMVERGYLDWDDKVTSYLPKVKLASPQSTQKLTVRHLLSHQTGLPSHSYDNLIESHRPYHEIILSLDKLPLNCSAGQCYNYQNAAYSLSGNILEVVAGQQYNTLLKRYIFQPLQMYDASATYEELMANPNHTDCHIGGGGHYTPCKIGKAYYAVAPAGGINASVNDMGQWLRAQLGAYPKVLSPHVLKTVHSPLVATPTELRQPHSPWRRDRLRSAHYGLGWRVYDYAGTPMIFHGGALRGTSAAIAFIPEKQVGIVVLTNANTTLPGLLIARFYDLYLDIPEKDWGASLLAAQKKHSTKKYVAAKSAKKKPKKSKPKAKPLH